MDLILWRHAEAELASELIPDSARKLTGKGIKQAKKIAYWLDHNLPENCRVLVSPAARTLQTAAFLDRKFKIVPELALGASFEEVLQVANWSQQREPVVIVGHQPYLGEIVTHLVGSIQECAIRKGNVWWISQKQKESGEVQTYLKAVMAPDLVTK